MGLLLICPRCRTRVPLTSRICGQCGGDLRYLPPEARRYFIGSPEAVVAAPASQKEDTWAALEPMEPEVVQAFPEEPGSRNYLPEAQEVSLCEALDRILHKGAVLFGEVTISVANIDLIYLGLQVILSSMETARELKGPGGGGGILGKNLLDQGVC